MRGMINWMGIIGLVTAAGCGGQAPAASTADPGAALNALASVTGYEACKGQCATGSMAMTAPMVSGSVTWSGTGDIGWQLNGKSGTISVPCGG